MYSLANHNKEIQIVVFINKVYLPVLYVTVRVLITITATCNSDLKE